MAGVKVKVSMEGDAEMREKLAKFAGDAGMRKQLRGAATEVWESKVPEMQERTPVQTGALRGTEKMRIMVSSKREEIRLTLIAGGPDAPYAYQVHENLTAKHPRGGGPHYMLNTLLEAATTAMAAIGGKIDLAATV